MIGNVISRSEVFKTERRWVVEFVGYLLVSLCALSVDIALLYFLSEAIGLPLLFANAISFLSGAAIVYLACIFLIFERRRFKSVGPEFLIFLGIGLIGLGVNELALWMTASIFGLQLILAKLFAAGASFTSNFLLRKFGLFK